MPLVKLSSIAAHCLLFCLVFDLSSTTIVFVHCMNLHTVAHEPHSTQPGCALTLKYGRKQFTHGTMKESASYLFRNIFQTRPANRNPEALCMPSCNVKAM